METVDSCSIPGWVTLKTIKGTLEQCNGSTVYGSQVAVDE